jgi:hypothetical protein
MTPGRGENLLSPNIGILPDIALPVLPGAAIAAGGRVKPGKGAALIPQICAHMRTVVNDPLAACIRS